jgi:hypothetical protein
MSARSRSAPWFRDGQEKCRREFEDYDRRNDVHPNAREVEYMARAFPGVAYQVREYALGVRMIWAPPSGGVSGLLLEGFP